MAERSESLYLAGVEEGNRQLVTGNLQSLIGAAVGLSITDCQFLITDGGAERVA
jgi:hypothetical protein